MLEITKEQLDNIWKVRDVCQEVSLSLNSLVEQSVEKDKQILNNDCQAVSQAIERMSALGYFNKKQVSMDVIKQLVNNIIEIEEKNSILTSKIWEKEITSIEKFTNENFKLCICRENKQSDFLVCKLISDKNIFISSNDYSLDRKLEFSSGYIYGIKDNFIAATDESDSVIIKKDNELSISDFLPVASSNGYSLFLNGYATKLKTPTSIIKKNSNNRFLSNHNVVVLNRNSKPCGVYVYTHPLSEFSNLYAKAKQLAEKEKLPLIEIDVLSFYKRNAKYANDNMVLRKCFNDLVDNISNDIKEFCGIDCVNEAKHLIGFNTNLRYNFLFKLFLNLSKKENLEKETMKHLVLKSIAKRNMLQKERERQNGGPLVYPTDNMPVALPVEFIN